MDIEEKVGSDFPKQSSLTLDERKSKQRSVTDTILEKMSDNLVKDLENREVNPDVYTFLMCDDLNKIINSLLK